MRSNKKSILDVSSSTNQGSTWFKSYAETHGHLTKIKVATMTLSGKKTSCESGYPMVLS